MKKWTEILISPNTSILHAIEVIDAGALKIALVVDEQNRLLGTITDGDIRRGILKGISLEEPVTLIMNPNPTVIKRNTEREYILSLMKNKQIYHIPIVDEQGIVLGLEVFDEMVQYTPKENWVIIMAGGLGSRLRPLTDSCPKPLLQVGNKPILETILENFIAHGFKKFFFTVNYKAEMIQEYFGDGSRWGVKIHYIYEEQKMGTAGALSLLPQKPDRSVIVMNGDILTKVNFNQLLNYHKENNASATVCVREFEIQIPYGVLNLNKQWINSIEEKPVQRYYISAGIYVLEPHVLDLIPKHSYYDMPFLLENMIKRNFGLAAFPVREYWVDVGHLDDFKRANGEFEKVFNTHAS
jgi:dTDP-glucose pyrophosphorylase/predicted transcriptional regulator